MPINIENYSNLIIQELARQDRKPADVLLAWIIAWAYSNKDELLARQIIRQVKEQFVEDFQQAYNQCIEKLGDNEFRNNALRAFNIAIAKYRVREAIKNVSYDAPTERVIEGLKEIAALLPKSAVLDRLISDIEEVLKIKGGAISAPTATSPTSAPTAQPAPPAPTTAPTTTPPTAPATAPQVTPPVTQPVTTAPTAAPAPPMQAQAPAKEPQIDMDSIKKIIEEVLSENIGVINEMNRTVLDLSKRVNKLDTEIENLKGLISTIDRHIREIKKSVKEKPPSLSQPAPSMGLSSQVIDTFKDIVSFVGLNIDEQKIRQYVALKPQESIPPKQKPPPEKIPAPKPVPKVSSEMATPPIAEAPEKPEILPEPKQVEAKHVEVPEPAPKIPVKPSQPVVQQPSKPAPVVAAPGALPEIPKPEEVLMMEQKEEKARTVRDVFIVAIGDLRKITEMLAQHKDKSKPWRWNLSISSAAVTYNVTIQGAARRMPRRIQQEIQEKSEGILVIGLYDQGIARSVMGLVRLLPNIKFVVWCEATVPEIIKNLNVSIESGVVGVKEDFIEILKRALFKAYEAG